MPDKSHGVLALSGGLDSTVLLWDMIYSSLFHSIECVSFKYGSKHNLIERNMSIRIYKQAAKFMDLHGIAHSYQTIDITQALDLACMRSAIGYHPTKVPEGHYNSENMRGTVIPGRNLIFSAILASIAESGSRSEALIALGIHAGDHHIYPDCRASFVTSLITTLKMSSDGKVGVWAPFLFLPKAVIVKRGLNLNAPLEITRTCYTAEEIACGRCGSCQERLASFAQLGIADPIEYESRKIFPAE